MSSINIGVLFDIDELGSSYRAQALRILMGALDPMQLCSVLIYEGDIEISSEQQPSCYCIAIQEQTESTGSKRSEYFKQEILKLTHKALLPKEKRIVQRTANFDLIPTGRIDVEGRWRVSGVLGGLGDLEAARVGLEFGWKVLPEDDHLGEFAVATAGKIEGTGLPWPEEDKLLLVTILKEFSSKLTTTAVQSTELSAKEKKDVLEVLQRHVWSKSQIIRKPMQYDEARYQEFYEFATKSEYGSDPGLGLYGSQAEKWARDMMTSPMHINVLKKKFKALFEFAKASEYSSESGLGLSASEAKEWAINLLGSTYSADVAVRRFKELYKIAQKSDHGKESGLGMHDRDAKEWAITMMDIDLDINEIGKRFKEFYDFARKSEDGSNPGLGMYDSKAQEWAAKIMKSSNNLSNYKELKNIAKGLLRKNDRDADEWALEKMKMEPHDLKAYIAKEKSDLKAYIAKKKSKAYWQGFWSESFIYGILLGALAGLLLCLFLWMRTSSIAFWSKLGFWAFMFIAGITALASSILLFFSIVLDEAKERGETAGGTLAALIAIILWLFLATTIFSSLKQAFSSILNVVISV